MKARRKTIFDFERVFLLVVTVGVIGTSALFYFTQIRPWRALPQESVGSINNRWKTVEELARREPTCFSSRGNIAAVFEKTRECDRGWAVRYLHRVYNDELFHDQSKLPPCALEGIDRLISWHESDGGMDFGGDSDIHLSALDDNLVELRIVGKAALATANSSNGSSRIPAVLDLSAKMRKCGDYVTFRVGSKLAHRVCESERALNLGLSGLVRERAPTYAEILKVAARMVVFEYEILKVLLMVRELKTEDDPDVWDQIVPSYSNERELLVYKQTWAIFFEEALKVKDQPEELRKIAARLSEFAITKSETVDEISENPRFSIERLVKDVDQARECTE